MRHLLPFCLFFSPLLLSAQKNFQEGHIVTSPGDTLRGFIDFREWNQNPERIRFSADASGEGAAEYNATTLRSFEVRNKEAYERHLLKISLDPVQLSDLRGRDTSTKTATVFLKVLYRGKSLSLYSYADKIKQRFYVLQEGAAGPEELVYREFYKGTSLDDYSTDALVREKTFQQQLKNILYTRGLYTPKLADKIETVPYEEKALKEVVYQMEGMKKQEEKHLKAKQPSSVRFFAGAGLQQNKLAVTGDHFFAANTQSTSALRPRFSAGADLLVNPHVGKLLFRLEGGYQTNRSKLTTTRPSGYQATYELSMSTITLYPQVIFNVYHSPAVKIPVGAGMGYSLSSFSKNYYSEVDLRSGKEGPAKDNYFDLKKVSRNVLGRVGVVYRNRLEASFLYFPATIMDHYRIYNISTTGFQFHVNYLFPTKKPQ
ncbi:hypothetical protein V9K67_13195 [Paraflavisolibacter sp. H34]|uniref:hypothetical protein n=1 Tax=Huijunlia imazamoxiresistens TaxID=3127457 RepID=UPI003015971C